MRTDRVSDPRAMPLASFRVLEHRGTMLPPRMLPILAQVQDPRVARTRAHKLVDVLMIALLACINGAEGWDEMLYFAKIIHVSVTA